MVFCLCKFKEVPLVKRKVNRRKEPSTEISKSFWNAVVIGLKSTAVLWRSHLLTVWSKMRLTNTAMSIFKMVEFNKWAFQLSTQELLLFITLKGKWRKWLVLLKDKWCSSFFPQGRNTIYIKLVCWGCVVVASSLSLFPRAISGRSRNALQDKTCQSTDSLSGSLRLCYFWAFILNKFEGREWV